MYWPKTKQRELNTNLKSLPFSTVATQVRCGYEVIGNTLQITLTEFKAAEEAIEIRELITL
jgi:hypothetical protein